ncbi:PR-1-like protein [Martensiomyces pterosporus]|nr:PR-1-like protein [Martensiomyces pterosporus]
MVKFASVLLLTATALLGSLVGAAPVQVDMLARRDLHEVNPNYSTYSTNGGSEKTVTVTVTKYVTQNSHNGHNGGYKTTSQQAPAYSTQPMPSSYVAQPSPSPSYSDWQQQMLQQVNDVRAKAGKQPLKLDSRLNKMAQDHSDYQNSIKTMTHDDSAGSLGQRCSNVDVQWHGVAENVAWNYPDVTAVVQGWVESPGHYANMIGDYTICGFGVNNLYWTQDFASD